AYEPARPLPGQPLRREGSLLEGDGHRLSSSREPAVHQRGPERGRQARILLPPPARGAGPRPRHHRASSHHQRRAQPRLRLRGAGGLPLTGTVSALGPLMLDVAGTELTDDDRRRLRHPLTGGVILFSRNYSGPEQLAELTAAIHALRRPPLLIAVDHEGGRIQRFREHFTAIPPMRLFGRIWDEDPARARELAGQAGFVLASELLAHGIDMTFAPVLDLDYGTSRVIGDRAFHARPRAVSELGRALLKGLRQAGMTGVGKHFPGHGHVHGDSHHEAPVDERPFREIE